MTYAFLFTTLLMDPGYLPEWMKTPQTQDKKAPVELLRIFNLRLWRANNITNYEQFFDDDENSSVSQMTQASEGTT